VEHQTVPVCKDSFSIKYSKRVEHVLVGTLQLICLKYLSLAKLIFLWCFSIKNVLLPFDCLLWRMTDIFVGRVKKWRNTLAYCFGVFHHRKYLPKIKDAFF